MFRFPEPALLPDLIGASTKINNLGDYADVFKRVWDALKIPKPLKPLLATSAGRSESLYGLFERRHSLVHEIRNAQIGHYLLRDTWTFEDAIANGMLVVRVIAAVEKLISEFVPDDFPNKLDHEGNTINQEELLEKQISETESKIAAAVEPNVANELKKAKKSFEQSLKSQVEFVEAALIAIPKRYYDPTPTIIKMLLRQRLEFVSALAKELES